MRTCIALVWVFSYPKRPIPQLFKEGDGVYNRDVEAVVKLVRDLFPMMRDACDQVVALQCSKGAQNVSPTSIVQTDGL